MSAEYRATSTFPVNASHGVSVGGKVREGWVYDGEICELASLPDRKLAFVLQPLPAKPAPEPEPQPEPVLEPAPTTEPEPEPDPQPEPAPKTKKKA